MRKGCVAAFLYLLFAAFMVSDGLFTSKVGISMEGLSTLKPWSDQKQVDWTRYNPALDFQAFFIFPWTTYAQEQMRDGHIPLWTHLSGGGAPFLGNLSSACFYPLNLLGLLVPPALAFSLAGLIKLWLGALLTYSLLRLYRLRFLSAFVGGLAFGFSGFQICWLMHPNSNVAVFLPALFLGCEYLVRRRNGMAVLVNALLFGLMILGGSPEVAFLFAGTWGLYLLYRVRQETGLFSTEGLSILFFGAITGLLGASLAAFQLWPFFEYLSHSRGLELRIEGLSHFLNGGPARLFTLFGFFLGLLFPILVGAFIGLLQRKNTVFIGICSGLLGGLCLIVALRVGFWLGARPHLLMQILPELYGEPAGGCLTAGEVSYSALNGGYAGVLIACLALYTLVAPCKRRPLPFFIFILVFSFGTAHSIPWLVHMVKAAPVLGWVNNSCILSLTAFSFAVIAPFGMEDLIFRAAQIYKGRSAAIAGVLTALAVLALALVQSGWTFFQTGFNLLEEERQQTRNIVIANPKEGSLHHYPASFEIKGYTTEKVQQVRAMIDGIFVGDVRTRVREDRSEGYENYSREYSYLYSLNTVDEGTYRVAVFEVQPGQEDQPAQNDEERACVSVRVALPKAVTQKDLLVIYLSVFSLLLCLSRAVPPSVRVSGVLVVLFVDLALFGLYFNKSSQPEDLYPKTGVTDFLAKQEKPFRFFAEGGVLHPNTHVPYGIEHMEWDGRLGVDGYCKVINHIKFDHLARPSQLKVKNFDVRRKLFDFLGVKYVLVHKDTDSPRFLKLAGKFNKVFEDEGTVLVYENTQALDRAFLLGDWVLISEKPVEDLINRDPCQQAILEEDPLLEKGGSGIVTKLSYEPHEVRISVETKGQALLILTDNFFPGWHAVVDGKEERIIKTTGSFRAVPIREEGRHEVVFQYKPTSFYGGLYLSLAALAVLLMLVLVPALTRSMRKKTEEVPEYLMHR